ncbi:DUF3110 domain-containing protein [Prochlorothrix hollandica]|nr:DUF3110 domain-containing protein [Prochlorothrix hollandica]
MQVFVLLYKIAPDQEGIHTLRMGDRNVVLIFEEEDDASRYAMLLEAQDFMLPDVECLDRQDVEDYCAESGYDYRLVPQGFIPQNDTDRLLLAPPEKNIDPDLDALGEENPSRRPGAGKPEADTTEASEFSQFSQRELDSIRRRLEGLL